ncbi:hypothetical protein C5167_018032 [Papaver somniferum]|uniref:Leucine-rich repeat-containing N-terminal plant-type domain-containing protein n=1 Tax=Papaver somniferum TaxID=3469 RepID=A0A4Y7IQ56_PAPSO|nr:receptor-like protein EIX2 [Papaver somniferum]RZC49605.1 hypothetical protein C5167_018032 [Papaver somniferum]
MELSLRSRILVFFLGLFVSTPNYIKLSSGEVCNKQEVKSLLTFKKDLKDPSSQLSSWSGEDCCKWNGVICNNKTQIVELNLQSFMLGGELSTSLQELKQLEQLDLSSNDFQGIQIPSFLGSLQNLRYLNLSRAGFDGTIPYQLGNLSNLRYLDISSSVRYDLTATDDLQWISRLSSLQHLDMSGVNLSSVTKWFHTVNMLPYLLELRLSASKLGNSSIPSHSFINFTSLTVLDLSQNYIISSLPEWLYNLSSLVQLNLNFNNFGGAISKDISQLTSLTSLELSANELEGEAPTTMRNLCNLQVMDLSGNKFRGEISGFLKGTSSCLSGSLRFLSLEVNQFTGPLPDHLGNLHKLEYLSLKNNEFSGPIPFSLGRLSLLKKLDLRYNQLNGSLPASIHNLSKLEALRTSYNSLEGVLTEAHFDNLAKLQTIEMDSLVIKFSQRWNPPFQLIGASFRSCQLGPQFPKWLQTQTILEEINLSSTGIASTVPTWFWNMTSQFTYLNLSNNQITGELPKLFKSSPFSAGIYLNSNQFTGQLPRISSDIRELDLSNNSFSGTISKLLCDQVNANRLKVLDLSRNLLSGEIPQCWMYWRSLKLVRLGSNNLTGKIPSSMGKLILLQSLHLRNNSLTGELPLSLQNCTELRTMDLGENRFEGNIPTWLGESYPNLIVLRLRLNKFRGGIPPELCYLPSLQLLDLAHNNLSGSIPRCFSNFSGMASQQNSSTRIFYSIVYGEFVETGLLVTKGREFEYSNTLTLVTSMDLSKNRLSGDIPNEITTLVGLRSLNLSENKFVGGIPQQIGKMSLLESLDFSNNNLSGSIPRSILDLNFLSHLNLSYNNLSGRIPLNPQLQGLTEWSYIGNTGLCGLPFLNSCTNGDEESKNTNGRSVKEENEDDDWIETKWFYLSLILGLVIGVWGFCGFFVLKKSWRYAYFGSIENMTVNVINYFCHSKTR